MLLILFDSNGLVAVGDVGHYGSHLFSFLLHLLRCPLFEHGVVRAMLYQSHLLCHHSPHRFIMDT